MQQTRILLVELPRMLHEILRTTIDEQPDMVVVDIPGWSGVEAGLEEIDVVVSGDGDGVAHRLVQHSAHIRFFALSAGGKESQLYELRPHRVPLGEMSPAQLVAAIRGAVRPGDRPKASTR